MNCRGEEIGHGDGELKCLAAAIDLPVLERLIGALCSGNGELVFPGEARQRCLPVDLLRVVGDGRRPFAGRKRVSSNIATGCAEQITRSLPTPAIVISVAA